MTPGERAREAMRRSEKVVARMRKELGDIGRGRGQKKEEQGKASDLTPAILRAIFHDPEDLEMAQGLVKHAAWRNARKPILLFSWTDDDGDHEMVRQYEDGREILAGLPDRPGYQPESLRWEHVLSKAPNRNPGVGLLAEYDYIGGEQRYDGDEAQGIVRRSDQKQVVAPVPAVAPATAVQAEPVEWEKVEF